MGGVLAKVVFKTGDEDLPKKPRELEEIEITDIDGNIVRIGDIMESKKVVLFVNVATKWGLTASNYRVLTDLHK